MKTIKIKYPKLIKIKIFFLVFLFFSSTLILLYHYFISTYKNVHSLDYELKKFELVLALNKIIDDLIKERYYLLQNSKYYNIQVNITNRDVNNFYLLKRKYNIYNFPNLNLREEIKFARTSRDVNVYSKLIEDLSKLFLSSMLSINYPDLSSLYMFIYLSSLYKNYLYLEEMYLSSKYKLYKEPPYKIIRKLRLQKYNEIKLLLQKDKIDIEKNLISFENFRKNINFENLIDISNIYDSYIKLWSRFEKIYISNKLNKIKIKIYRKKVTFYELLIFISFIFIIILLSARRFYNEIANLLNQINKIYKNISQNSFGTRLTVERKNELGEISSYINLILDILEKSLNELKLTVAHEEAFAKIISHEIKNFLSGIYFALEKLKNSNLSKEDRKILEDTLKSLTIIKLLLEDLADLSQIRKKRIVLEEKIINLKELFENVVNIILYRKKPSVEFEIDFENIDNYYLVDPKRFSQIIINLLSNAFKYTQKGKVKLKVFIEPKDKNIDILNICVEDTGVGIPDKDKENIFHLFSRTSLTKNIEGTGIGLYIVKNIVEALNGSIEFESKENKGTCFKVKIPIKKVDKKELNKSIKKTEEKTKPSLKDINLLIVDDIALNRELIKLLAKGLGIKNIFEAYSKESFLEALKNNKIDVIFLDYHLPPYEASQILKEKEVLNYLEKYKPKIYILSGEGLTNEKLKDIENLIDGILEKPIRAEDLKRVMENI